MVEEMDMEMSNSSFVWFEFLLNDQLLFKHLNKENPDPSPCALLTQFLIHTDKFKEEPNEGEETIEKLSRSKKSRSLKLMALQTAAFVHWDLEVLAKLSLLVQQSLMKHVHGFLEQSEFLGSLYHRWVLRSSQAPLKGNFAQDPMLDGIVRSFNSDLSLHYLENLIAEKKNPREIVLIPTPKTFSVGTSDFSIGIEVSTEGFLSMLHLDMGIHLLYKGNSPAAAEHFKKQRLPLEDFPFFQIGEGKLNGYLKAVGVLKDNRIIEDNKSQLENEKNAVLLRKGSLAKLKKSLNLHIDTFIWERGLAPDQVDKPPADESITALEKRLLETSVPLEVNNLLLNLNSLCGGKKSFSRLFTSWDLPTPVQHATLKIPAGPLQDYIYILVAKSKQFLNMKLYEDSRNWLQLAKLELNDHVNSGQGGPAGTHFIYNLTKLSKMLEWEMLLVDIAQLFEEWPKKGSDLLVSQCKECLICFQSQTSELKPRSEIVENILIVLINVEEYKFVTGFDHSQQRWPFLEFLVLLGTSCIDLCEKKDSAASFRELWYAVLPIFSANAPVKRQPAKGGMIQNRSVLMWVIERSRSHVLMSLFVSLLSRLHNHILDDVALLIQTEYLHIWPNVLDDVTTSSELKSRVAGGSKLNARHIRDVLFQLLKRPIKGEVVWLKCTGDVYLASGNPALAIKCYLEYLALCTDFFEKHSVDNWRDEGLLRKMIKCCENMQAFTQALILCQFLPNVDYSLAFGMAQEKMTTDSSDALYGFIWDLTILEFLVNLHTKRNEVGKRQQAIRVMGLLELNANNNDEIQREAMHLRQSQFMRTLAKLYIFI